MIQDLGSHCYHNEYRPVPPKGGDCILFFQERKVLVKITEDTFPFLISSILGNIIPGFINLIPIYSPLMEGIIILPKKNL